MCRARWTAIPIANRAELVLQNTRQSGTRIPIDGFAVLMGRSSKCDVQLDVDGIQPLHCILIDGPEGFLVRGVSDGTITVNDQQVDSILLADGDQLAIGSFVFQIEIHEASSVDRDERVALQKARSAVRIQAAAVAAQQAALDEEEQRLNLQRVASIASKNSSQPTSKNAAANLKRCGTI